MIYVCYLSQFWANRTQSIKMPKRERRVLIKLVPPLWFQLRLVYHLMLRLSYWQSTHSLQRETIMLFWFSVTFEDCCVWWKKLSSFNMYQAYMCQMQEIGYPSTSHSLCRQMSPENADRVFWPQLNWVWSAGNQKILKLDFGRTYVMPEPGEYLTFDRIQSNGGVCT